MTAARRARTASAPRLSAEDRALAEAMAELMLSEHLRRRAAAAGRGPRA